MNPSVALLLEGAGGSQVLVNWANVSSIEPLRDAPGCRVYFITSTPAEGSEYVDVLETLAVLREAFILSGAILVLQPGLKIAPEGE